ncbi:MAG: hypothetical protein Q8Q09_01405 [Deltaproteobacteria bacterium]|nr:hypothetical protein [Deltaproteobacteria bacterium]
MANRWLKAATLIAAMGIWGSGCIINVGGGNTRNTYQSCSPGDTCTGISVCQTSAITLAGSAAGALCTTSCTVDTQCPSSPSTGNTSLCLSTTGGSGQCFAKCMTNTDCAAGTTCGAVQRTGPGGTMSINVCIPGSGSVVTCGGIGQACCGGNTCNDAAGACASDGICKPRAYIGCTAASANANAACTDAPNQRGQNVQTICTRPPFTNAGPDGFCSTVCDGTNESCPTFAGSTTGCYTFAGMTRPMCFVDCATNPNICPSNTQCVMLTGNTGAQVRVCAPPVSG